eukprot:Polyplicarium_translucidae@DN906_c0_g1_i1.p1
MEERQEQLELQRVQTFGRKKNAVAVALCTGKGRKTRRAGLGKGMIKVNGVPLELVRPEILRVKLFEPMRLIGMKYFEDIDMRIRVRGGGYTSQIYAIRQAIAKAVVAYHQKYVDEATKREIREKLVIYDRSLVVSDPRRCEPKKFGGLGARARFQKSYR